MTPDDCIVESVIVCRPYERRDTVEIEVVRSDQRVEPRQLSEQGFSTARTEVSSRWVSLQC